MAHNFVIFFKIIHNSNEEIENSVEISIFVALVWEESTRKFYLTFICKLYDFLKK